MTKSNLGLLSMLRSKWFLLPVLLAASLGWLWLAKAALQPGELSALGIDRAGGQGARLAQRMLLEREPPSVLLFEQLWGSLAGSTELALRLPGLCLGLLNILLMYALGTRLLTQRVAMLAAILMALSPLHLWYTAQADGALLPMTLTLAAAVAFYRLADAGRLLCAGLVYALAALALTLGHSYGIVFVVCFSFLAQVSRMHGARRVHFCGLLCLLAYAGYRYLVLDGASMVLPAGSLGNIGLWDPRALFLGWLASGRIFAPLLGGMGEEAHALFGLQPWLAVAMQGLALVLLLRGLLTLVRSQHLAEPLLEAGSQRRPASAHTILLLLVLPGSLLLVSLFSGHGALAPRAFLPLLPFFLITLAAGLAVGPASERQQWFSLSLGCLFKLDLLLFALQPGAWSVDEPRVDWRAAAGYLAAELDAGSTAREAYVAYASDVALSHYDPRLQPRNWRERSASLAAELQPLGTLLWPSGKLLLEVDALEADYERSWEARRMSLIGIQVSPLRTSGPSRDEKLPFYLIFQQHPGQDFFRLQPLLLPPVLQDLSLEHKLQVDPTLATPLPTRALLRIAEQRRFDSLVILKMAWVDA